MKTEAEIRQRLKLWEDLKALYEKQIADTTSAHKKRTRENDLAFAEGCALMLYWVLDDDNARYDISYSPVEPRNEKS